MEQSTPPSFPLSPCAACRLLRRRCVKNCILAPYFPSTDPIRFTAAHRIFGASDIVKHLQDLPVSQRDDAVSSLVYEAASRIQDPVYGSAGVVCKLQKQVGELQAELARVRAELVCARAQHASFLASVSAEMASSASAAAASVAAAPRLPESPVEAAGLFLSGADGGCGVHIDDRNPVGSTWQLFDVDLII